MIIPLPRAGGIVEGVLIESYVQVHTHTCVILEACFVPGAPLQNEYDMAARGGNHVSRFSVGWNVHLNAKEQGLHADHA